MDKEQLRELCMKASKRLEARSLKTDGGAFEALALASGAAALLELANVIDETP